MIAAIYFDHDKWWEMLRAAGCTEVVGKVFRGRTQDYFVWQTPWGHQFMAPHHVTYSEAADILAAEVEGTRPTKH